MRTFKKWVGIVAATSMLTTLAPIGASAAVQTDKKPSFADNQILVKVKPGKDLKKVATKLGAGIVEDLGQTNQWKLVKVPAGKAAEFLDKFKSDADVEQAELDEVIHINRTPSDPSYAAQYHHKRIQADLAWDIHTGTDGATIAVVDTGVDLDHPDLASKIVAGYDFVNNDNIADDDEGHGTHCAGTAAAIGNNAYQGSGVSWGALIMPIKVMSRAGSTLTSTVIKGIDFAQTNGADVILLSFGGGGSYTQAFQDSINAAWSAGAHVVAPAGNLATNTPTYPANYANVISVASTDSADIKSSFSSFGTWVDVAAPGSSIYATAIGGGMTTKSGTPMAASVVAGMVALVRTKNLNASNATVQSRIFSTADRITYTGSYWMHGRVNAYRAVNGF